VLDSVSVNVLINFTSERFGIAVPQDEVTQRTSRTSTPTSPADATGLVL
jgi:acyl carrier protein